MLGLSLAASVLMAACQPSAPAASPTAKPAAGATSAPASPAAKPAESPAAAKPAASPAASPVASPAAGGAPTAAKPSATADPALASTWQGKTMTIMVGFPPGGGNDTWARLVSRHYGKHLPGNPTIIVENLPGAGGVIMANRLQESRPDGLTIGIHDRGISAVQLQGEEGVRYDVTKWTWLGSLTIEEYFYVVHQRTGVTPANLDLLKTKEIKTANVSPGGFSHLMEVALKYGLGWKLTPIFGYQGNRETVLSIDRGETDAVAISWTSLITQKRDELQSKVMVPLVQMGGQNKDPLAAGVPTVQSLFTNATPEAKQVLNFVETPLNWSRSMSTPPGLEPRVAASMRAAFAQMMADPEFLADAAQLKFDIIPVPGEKVQEMMGEYMKTPKAIVDLVEEQVKKDVPN